jgi:hypothetical protein
MSRSTKHQGYRVQSYRYLGWHTAHSVKSLDEAIEKCDRLHARLIVNIGHPLRTRVVGPDGQRVYPTKKKPGG